MILVVSCCNVWYLLGGEEVVARSRRLLCGLYCGQLAGLVCLLREDESVDEVSLTDRLMRNVGVLPRRVPLEGIVGHLGMMGDA
jgi:hypothetical protein